MELILGLQKVLAQKEAQVGQLEAEPKPNQALAAIVVASPECCPPSPWPLPHVASEPSAPHTPDRGKRCCCGPARAVKPEKLGAKGKARAGSHLVRRCLSFYNRFTSGLPHS